MRKDDAVSLRGESEPVPNATGPATEAHLKAGRDGRLLFGVAIVFLIITGIGAFYGFNAIYWTAAGIALALFVVGLILTFDSERQRQRRDASKPRQ